MKIVDASYKIIEPELQEMTIFERLETCGRVCYKSEDKITEFSSIPFCKRMISNQHMSTMEMAMIHLCVYFDGVGSETDRAIELVKQAKYLIISDESMIDGKLYISGSVRAFIELFNNDWKEDFESIHKVLHESYPEFFQPREFDECGDADVEVMHQSYMPYKHHCYAVRFIVNRAVTHELVRHRPVTYLQESQRYCNYGAGKFNNEVTFINPKAFFDTETIDYNIWYRSCQASEIAYLRLLDAGNSPQAARTVLPNSCKTEIIVYTNTEEWEHIFKLRTSSAAEPSMREVMIPLEIEMREKGFLKQKV